MGNETHEPIVFSFLHETAKSHAVSMEDALEDAQNDTAQLPGVGRDGITSVLQSSRWMQTLGRGESSQRAPQSCNEYASLESDVENACNSALYATVASHRPIARQDSEQMVCSHTEQLIAMIFQTGSGENGHGNQQCAWHVAVGNVVGMHLDIFAIPGPFHMQNHSST